MAETEATSAETTAASRVPAIEPLRGVVLEAHQVILRPLITEKNVHKAERLAQYSFEISSQATKDDVRHAVESLFNVKVLKVRTQSRRGKHRRYRFRMGETKNWRKAVVTLHPDNRIDFF
jgi:large subunit ribosomal protein L23